MSTDSLSEPWRSFLLDLDRQLKGRTDLHCFGGFIVAECYGLMRPTADIDIIDAVGATNPKELGQLAGRASALAKEHRVYLDIVTVAVVPEDYESRLINIYPGLCQHLQLKAFERHDLVLAKLSRNGDRDREDVRRLAAGPGLDVEILKARYARELRSQCTNVERPDLTLALWVGIIEEVSRRD